MSIRLDALRRSTAARFGLRRVGDGGCTSPSCLSAAGMHGRAGEVCPRSHGWSLPARRSAGGLDRRRAPCINLNVPLMRRKPAFCWQIVMELSEIFKDVVNLR
jgi:hypothetical protein